MIIEVAILMKDDRDHVPRRNLHRHPSKNDNRFSETTTSWKCLNLRERLAPKNNGVDVALNGRRDANDITHCETTRMASRGRNRTNPFSLFLSLLFLRRWKAVNRGWAGGESHPCAPARTAPEPGGSIQSSCSLLRASPLRRRIAVGDLRRVDSRTNKSSKIEINQDAIPSFFLEMLPVIIQGFYILIKLSFELQLW